MISSEGTPVVDGNAVDGKTVDVQDGLSPGKRLSQGRLQLGLTQEQVAKELYITLVKIKALESDDYGRLNTDTFIRGYIRAYANLVKLDVVEVLSAYDQLLQARGLQAATQPGSPAGAAEAGTSPQPAAASSGSKSALQLLLVIAAFFLGLWLISVWFFNHEPDTNYTALSPVVSLYASSSESVSSQAGSSEANATRSADSAAAQRVNTPLLPVSSLAAVSSAASAKSRSAASSSLPLAGAQVSAQQVAVQNALQASSVAESSTVADKPKAAGLDTISFSFRAECWLEVSDSRGDVLATELQASGSSLTLVGKAPFDVKLGNAPAVAIQLNSKKIDVIPLLGSNVLTLHVSE